MLFSLQALASLLPGYIRLGSLRLTVYGIFAAAGLIAALWLSQRTAPRVDLPANKLWDAGVFAIIAAFAYHLVAGIRHLVWDTGRGLEKTQSERSAWMVIAGALVLTVVCAWWAFRAREGGV